MSIRIVFRSLLCVFAVGFVCQLAGCANPITDGLGSWSQSSPSRTGYGRSREFDLPNGPGDDELTSVRRPATAGPQDPESYSLTRFTRRPPAPGVQSLLDRGNEAYAENRLQEAIQLYQSVLDIDSGNADAHHRLGILADRDGRYQQAERHYRQALATDPYNADLLSDLGYSYFLQGNRRQSDHYLNQALRVNPTHQHATANLKLLREPELAETVLSNVQPPRQVAITLASLFETVPTTGREFARRETSRDLPPSHPTDTEPEDYQTAEMSPVNGQKSFAELKQEMNLRARESKLRRQQKRYGETIAGVPATAPLHNAAAHGRADHERSLYERVPDVHAALPSQNAWQSGARPVNPADQARLISEIQRRTIGPYDGHAGMRRDRSQHFSGLDSELNTLDSRTAGMFDAAARRTQLHTPYTNGNATRTPIRQMAHHAVEGSRGYKEDARSHSRSVHHADRRNTSPDRQSALPHAQYETHRDRSSGFPEGQTAVERRVDEPSWAGYPEQHWPETPVQGGADGSPHSRELAPRRTSRNGGIDEQFMRQAAFMTLGNAPSSRHAANENTEQAHPTAAGEFSDRAPRRGDHAYPSHVTPYLPPGSGRRSSLNDNWQMNGHGTEVTAGPQTMQPGMQNLSAHNVQHGQNSHAATNRHANNSTGLRNPLAEYEHMRAEHAQQFDQERQMLSRQAARYQQGPTSSGNGLSSFRPQDRGWPEYRAEEFSLRHEQGTVDQLRHGSPADRASRPLSSFQPHADDQQMRAPHPRRHSHPYTAGGGQDFGTGASPSYNRSQYGYQQ